MAKSLSDLADSVAAVISTGMRQGDPMRTQIIGWINQACRTIAYAFPWDERRDEQRIVTAAPYSTGTVTFTQDSTAITFSGATLVAGMVGRKISLGVGQPYYRIASVNTGAGTAVLSDEYEEATVAGSTYTIYQDEYDLAETTHSVETAALFQAGKWNPMGRYEQREFEGVYLGGSSGSPACWGITTSTTVGTVRVVVNPVPDKVYRIGVRYLKTWTDLAGPSDLYTRSLPVDVEELIVDRALRWAPKIEGSRRVMSDTEFRKELTRTWIAHNKARYRIGTRRSLIDNGWDHGILFGVDGLS
jgi:hypothetical protein